MFWKKSKSGAEQPTQSQTAGNVTGGSLQQTQAGRDAVANQSTEAAVQQQGLTNEQVLQELGRLEAEIAKSSLEQAQKDELLAYLKPAQMEVNKPEPKKERVGMSLEQVSEAMQNLKETTEAGKSLWQTGAEVVKTISPWLAMAGAVVPHLFGL